MEQLSQYFIFFLYTGGFCLALTLGLVVLLSGREFVQSAKLRRYFAYGLMLFGVHLLLAAFSPFFGPVLLIIAKCLLILIDLALLIFLFIAVIGSQSASSSKPLEASYPAAAAPQDVRTVQPASSTNPLEAADPATAAPRADGEFAEESDALNDEISEEDADDVEKLENPNVDDFLFFQKVEALMVNEMLFCEQELSRESLATAIGTNRTYLARSIKSATGKTFSEYITSLRTAYAAKLLTTTDEPLDLIGTLVGFRSKSAYYRAFAAAYNSSPSEYRKNSVCRSLDK